MLYISFVLPDLIIAMIASAVSSACNQVRIGEPLLCKGILRPNLRYFSVFGINFSTY